MTLDDETARQVAYEAEEAWLRRPKSRRWEGYSVALVRAGYAARDAEVEELRAERDRLDEAFDRDLPWRYDEVREQRNALAAEVEELRAELDILRATEDGNLSAMRERAEKAEATLAKVREYVPSLPTNRRQADLRAILDESPTERETPADEWEYGLADDGATEPYSDISTDRDWILDGVHPLDEGTRLLRRRPAGPWEEASDGHDPR